MNLEPKRVDVYKRQLAFYGLACEADIQFVAETFAEIERCV